MEISDVQLEDDEMYDCQIHGTKSPAAKLTIFVPPGDPRIDGGETVKDVIEDQEVTLRCVSKGGKPAPKVNNRV